MGYAAVKRELSWSDPQVVSRLSLAAGAAGIEVGGTHVKGGGQRFRLLLDFDAQQVRLEWRRHDSSSQTSVVEDYAEPIALVDGAVYELGLEMVEGQVRAWLVSPAVWTHTREEGGGWGALADVEDVLILTSGRERYSVSAEGKLGAGRPMVDRASEVRVWERPGYRRPWIGLCIPEVHHIAFGETGVTFLGEVVWPELAGRVGSGLGQADGELLVPLSFDVSLDGRFFVVDAGNSRIQVYNAEGQYVTQWGGPGNGEGEFDFGRGLRAEDFSGSVAVDDSGYVYVADVLNGRIQKFAP